MGMGSNPLGATKEGEERLKKGETLFTKWGEGVASGGKGC